MKNLRLFEEWEGVGEVDTHNNLIMNTDHADILTEKIMEHLLPIEKIRYRSMIHGVIKDYFIKNDID